MLLINNSVFTFKSRNNPVQDFKIQTSKGELLVREFSAKDAENHKDLYNLTKFFADGFISNTKDPSFLQYKDKKNKQKYLRMLDKMTDYYRNIFHIDDGNLTVLVAKNNKDKIVGAVITNTLNEAGVYEKSTCYVDSIAVDSKYRKNKVGQILQNKAIECSKSVYQDVFLASDNLAVGFQLKNGFRKMDYSNPSEKKVIDKINSERGDYPDYITFMDKKLSDSDKPWYERVIIDEVN